VGPVLAFCQFEASLPGGAKSPQRPTPIETGIMQSQELVTLVLSALDDGKGNDIKVIDVRDKTNITDYMVIASGTSDRHVASLADRVVERAKENQLIPLGVEGQNTGEWVLVDLGDAIIHVMKPQTREFYQLEKLWQGDYPRKAPTAH
jgi:ribosome-associated protein